MKPQILEKSSRYKRLLAIGDIHGCLFHLLDLLTVVKPTKDDLIVTLGDYIDRGLWSREVLEKLIRLHANPEINIVSLRGNHDALMLMVANRVDDFREFYQQPQASNDVWSAVVSYSPVKLWQNNGGRITLFSYSRLGEEKNDDLTDATAQLVPPQHIAFLRETCVDALVVEDFVFVHGGLQAGVPLFEQNLFNLHWLGFDEQQPVFGKKIICGHTIQRDFSPKEMDHAVCIDTGACLQRSGGKLSCMDVLSGQVWQVDGLYLPKEEL